MISPFTGHFIKHSPDPPLCIYEMTTLLKVSEVFTHFTH